MMKPTRRAFMAAPGSLLAVTGVGSPTGPGQGSAGMPTPDSMSYPQRPEERAAGIVPVSPQYPYPNVLRYMTAAQIADVTARTFREDVTAAIQTLINVGGRMGYFPAGLYRVSAAINVPATGGWHIWGDGRTLTELRAVGRYSTSAPGTSAIFNLGTAQTQSIRGRYERMKLSGEGADVRFGIYGSRVEEHVFEDVFCSHFVAGGMSIGFGYCNAYVQCEFSYGRGDGLVLNIDHESANNATAITRCLFLSNKSFGLRAQGGHGLAITDCTFELNDGGGIFNGGVTAMYVRGYFEKNASEGWTFKKPPATVRADIVLTGSGYAEMSAAYPVAGAVVEACVTEPRAHADAFVWNGGAVDLTVRNCRTNAFPQVPVVAEPYDDALKGEGLIVEGCSSFATQVREWQPRAGVNNSFAGSVRIASVAATNYAERDVSRWTAIMAKPGAAVRKVAAATIQFRGRPVWELNASAAGKGAVHGFRLSAEVAPELVGKTVWFGLWALAEDADCYLLPYCSLQSFNNNPTAVDRWTFVAVSFEWPAKGEIVLGVQPMGQKAGAIRFAAPMLAELGAPRDAVIGWGG